MPNDNNALVLSDNENGTQSATWTPVEEVTPEQKVLIGQLDPISGTIQAAWNPSSDAAVFKDGTFIENGVYDAQEDDCDGYKTVTVAVPEPVLGTKTITANGTYTAASEEKTGFSEVTVNVPIPVSDKNAKFGATPTEFDTKKNIIKIDIPSGVTSLAGSVFNGATNLTEVNIPETVTTIGNSAFNGCTSLTELELPSALTSIGSYCFEGCTSLSSIDIPSTVTSIGTYAFNRCSALETITIHKAEGSITGSPWGAGEGTTIVWDGE